MVPEDLIPLPTMPYSERPTELPLDIEECRTAIWSAAGNLTEAAKLLKVTSLRLRNFVNKSPFLSAEVQESKEQVVDKAEQVVIEALNDEDDKSRRDTMSRFVLSNIGKSRGWGTNSGGNVNIQNKGGTIVVQWADGTAFGDSKPEDIIDVTPNEAA